jgi:hypothetical protein
VNVATFSGGAIRYAIGNMKPMTKSSWNRTFVPMTRDDVTPSGWSGTDGHRSLL